MVDGVALLPPRVLGEGARPMGHRMVEHDNGDGSLEPGF
jgi:hypothetical protein